MKLILILSFLFFGIVVNGQDAALAPTSPAHLGFPGLIYTPSAYLAKWKTVDIGYTHFSKGTSLTYEAGKSPERAFIASIAFLPFAEISLKLTRTYPNLISTSTTAWKYYGIGDRSVSLRLRLLKETKNRPAVVIGIQDPGISDLSFFNTNYVVLSKTTRFKEISISTNLGYGYSSKSEFLHGIFGGIQTSWKSISALAEYDTTHLNIGVGYQIKNLFFIKAALAQGKYFSGNASFRFQLK